MTVRKIGDPGVNFRLSRHVWPRRYDLALLLDLETWQSTGTVEIALELREPTDVITLHALDLTIGKAILTHAGAERPEPAEITVHSDAEAVSLVWAHAIPAGAATLTIDFTGEIVEKLRGLYRSVKDGHRYAATQFESADARRAFPCFDEPEFKARFALTLNVPADLTAIANGAIAAERAADAGRKILRFTETPPISSYLVAFCVGPFEATPETRTRDDVPVRVWLPRGLADKGVYARDAHARAVEYLARYTDIPYPYGKIDAIGLADFEAGAMENPGAITYRLTAIAADPAQASVDTLQDIFYTAAHELTHMWWGDLVTMAWWNDLWLNESFATFVGWKTSADLNPEWGMWRDFVATLARPFALDALVSTHPISFNVENARQAAERFDAITYWKGAGVVRMIEGFLGADAFRSAVRSYLRRYAERNATADDFWRELGTASGRDVSTIANAWISEPGHPVVEITTTPESGGLRLALRQRRFFSDPELAPTTSPQLWPVPLVIKHGDGTAIREERVLLSEREDTVTLPSARWLYPNGSGAGFYRFALDDAAIVGLSERLQAALSPEERLNLIGNQWALIKAGIASIQQFVTILEGYRGETDRAVLEAIAERLAWLEIHALDDAARPASARLVEELFGAQFTQLGWDPRPDEPSDERMKRAAVIGTLGRLAKLPAILEEVPRRLARYFDDRASLDPNLVPTVAHLAARGGDEALYARFLARKRASSQDPEEEERFLFGLASFEDPALVGRTLELTFTDDVRPQDRAFVLARLLGGRASRLTAWAFVRDGWDARILTMDPMLRQYVIRGMAGLTPVAREVGQFLAEHVTDETRETTAQAREQLRIDAAAAQRIRPELTRALLARTPTR